MDDHGNLRQFVNGVEVQRAKSNATREPGGQIRVVASPAAIRVRGDEPRHGKARILHQPAAQRLTDDVLAADLAPPFDRDVTQDDRFSAPQIDR
jgi:hypothetical protein